MIYQLRVLAQYVVMRVRGKSAAYGTVAPLLPVEPDDFTHPRENQVRNNRIKQLLAAE